MLFFFLFKTLLPFISEIYFENSFFFSVLIKIVKRLLAVQVHTNESSACSSWLFLTAVVNCTAPLQTQHAACCAHCLSRWVWLRYEDFLLYFIFSVFSRTYSCLGRQTLSFFLLKIFDHFMFRTVLKHLSKAEVFSS